MEGQWAKFSILPLHGIARYFNLYKSEYLKAYFRGAKFYQTPYEQSNSLIPFLL